MRKCTNYHHIRIEQKGKAALHLASYKGHVDIVKVLLKAGAEVNMQMEVCTCTPSCIHVDVGTVAL